MEVLEDEKVQAYDENDVLDHTYMNEGEREHQHSIRLSVGLDTSKLIKGEGAVLVPELDEELFETDAQSNADFFNDLRGQDEETISKAVDALDLNMEDGDFDDEDFTFKSKSLKMTDVTADGGVKKKLLKPGLEYDCIVPANGTVTLHYSMFLEGQDEPYDSSKVRGRCERFRLDDGQLLPGVEIAVKTMKKREKAEFLIQPDYAFGPMGCPPRIPGESQIMAILEVLDFVQEGQTDSLLAMQPIERSKKYTFDEIEKQVSIEHREGNSLYKKGEYKLAARRYQKGCRLLEEVDLHCDDHEKRQQRLLVKLYLNRAHCYSKVMWPKPACLVLQEALDIEPNNPKGLYRMGRAKRDLGNYEDARRFLMKAQAVSDDPAIGKELASLDKQLKDEQDNKKAMCRRMFKNSGNSRNTNRSARSEVDIPDEDYEEIAKQLKYFKKDQSENELVLPSGMTQDDLRVTRMIADKIGGIELREFKVGSKKQWKIVKV